MAYFTADSDFTPPDSLDVLFTEEGSQCFNFTILDDACVEDDESFEVSLTTSDDDVDIHSSLTFIFIIDTDGKRFRFKTIYLFLYSHLVALFSVRQEIENVVESAESLMLCVELVDGCLQRPVRILHSTFDGTAQSTLVRKSTNTKTFPLL